MPDEAPPTRQGQSLATVREAGRGGRGGGETGEGGEGGGALAEQPSKVVGAPHGSNDLHVEVKREAFVQLRRAEQLPYESQSASIEWLSWTAWEGEGGGQRPGGTFSTVKVEPTGESSSCGKGSSTTSPWDLSPLSSSAGDSKSCREDAWPAGGSAVSSKGAGGVGPSGVGNRCAMVAGDRHRGVLTCCGRSPEPLGQEVVEQPAADLALDQIA